MKNSTQPSFLLYRHESEPAEVKNTTFSLELILSILVSCVVIFNGVFNKFFGEMASEGLAISFSLVYLSLKIKLQTRFFNQLLVLIFFIVFSILCSFSSLELYRLLFLYPYLFLTVLLLLPIYEHHSHINSSLLSKTIIYFAIISAAYAILQRLGVDFGLPLETSLRATGLSRSSLNLSGCLFSSFSVCVLTVRESIKKIIALSILYCGIIAAGGRGSMIAAIILLLLYYSPFLMAKKSYLIIFSSVFTLIVLFSRNHFLKAFSVFDFHNDQSNLDRLTSYMKFFDEFTFFGGGIASTSPAVMRFAPSTGFESSALNTVYELGFVFTAVFLIALALWQNKLIEPSRFNIIILIFSASPLLFGQQLYGAPSAFVSLILAIFVILSTRSQLTL